MCENELLRRQDQLQAEANRVAEELDMDDLLSLAGNPVRVAAQLSD
ncbi:hypothetical protein CM49_01177 [Paenibacillus sp. P1XP2]|nr:hypothetical protein CM49_01177 [Paenibacillus sp. P1XP2]